MRVDLSSKSRSVLVEELLRGIHFTLLLCMTTIIRSSWSYDSPGHVHLSVPSPSRGCANAGIHMRVPSTGTTC